MCIRQNWHRQDHIAVKMSSVTVLLPVDSNVCVCLCRYRQCMFILIFIIISVMSSKISIMKNVLEHCKGLCLDIGRGGEEIS